jgi:hypothetical protein
MKEGLFLFGSIENSLLVCTNIKAAQKELVWVGDRERGKMRVLLESTYLGNLFIDPPPPLYSHHRENSWHSGAVYYMVPTRNRPKLSLAR